MRKERPKARKNERNNKERKMVKGEKREKNANKQVWRFTLVMRKL